MSLIGKRVEFSHSKDTLLSGVVLSKIEMKESSTQDGIVTGFIVKDDNTDELYHLQYWRLKRMLQDDAVPTRAIPGGWCGPSADNPPFKSFNA
jgi:hypothetical protein